MAALHHQKNTMPHELLVPVEQQGSTIRRRLVLRNPLTNREMCLKLALNPPSTQAIQLSKEFVVIGPRYAVQIELLIDVSRLSTVGEQIRGYAHFGKDLNTWNEKSADLAFVLKVRASTKFSALDTIIDLPLLDSRGVEEAVPIDAGTSTARAFGSMENLVREMKEGRKGTAADWKEYIPAWKEDTCWWLTKWMGVTEEDKSKKSKKSGLRKKNTLPRSEYVQAELKDSQTVN